MLSTKEDVKLELVSFLVELCRFPEEVLSQRAQHREHEGSHPEGTHNNRVERSGGG